MTTLGPLPLLWDSPRRGRGQEGLSPSFEAMETLETSTLGWLVLLARGLAMESLYVPTGVRAELAWTWLPWGWCPSREGGTCPSPSGELQHDRDARLPSWPHGTTCTPGSHPGSLWTAATCPLTTGPPPPDHPTPGNPGILPQHLGRFGYGQDGPPRMGTGAGVAHVAGAQGRPAWLTLAGCDSESCQVVLVGLSGQPLPGCRWPLSWGPEWTLGRAVGWRGASGFRGKLQFLEA